MAAWDMGLGLLFWRPTVFMTLNMRLQAPAMHLGGDGIPIGKYGRGPGRRGVGGPGSGRARGVGGPGRVIWLLDTVSPGLPSCRDPCGTESPVVLFVGCPHSASQ